MTRDDGATAGNSRGFFARARYTPLRDAIRFRISGRLDLAHLLGESNLPASLRSLVQHVVRATRLWRIEKIDVASELTAHFRDGLDAGQSPDELAESFGDPHRAAKLIRRAKKRQRPVWWHGVRYSGYGLALLIVLYIGLAIRYFVGVPTISRDYVAELNRVSATAAPEESAWPLYRQALLLIEPQDWKKGHVALHPSDEKWEESAAWIARQSEALAIVREGATRPRMGFVAGHAISEADRELWPEMKDKPEGTSTLGLIDVLLPHLGESRQLANLLRADAWRAALEGDGTTATENIIAMLAIARHSAEIPTLISDLVSLSIIAMATQTAGEMLAEHGELFSDEALAELAHRFASAGNWPDKPGELRVRLGMERLFFHDVMQRLYTDNGRGGGRLTPHGLRFLDQLGSDYFQPARELPTLLNLAGPLASIVVADRKSMLAKADSMYDRMERSAAQPLWERVPSDVDSELGWMMGDAIARIRYMPVALLMPAIEKAVNHGDMAGQQRDALLVAIALELHRRSTGDWAHSLDELVPRYLPAIPRDRFDGGRIKYRPAAPPQARGSENGDADALPLIYSVGTNRIDEGGRPFVRDPASRWNAPSRWISQERLDQMRREAAAAGESPTGEWAQQQGFPIGDWILWPPVKE